MDANKIRRVLITGGAGFIGSHTADALITKGYTVRILDLLDPQVHGKLKSFPSYLDPEVECIRGDVRDPECVTTALEDVDAVFHFAALTGVGQSMYDIRSYVDTNCTGTATLIESIAKRTGSIRKVILSSSRAVYGEGTHECSRCGIVYPPLRKKSDLDQGRFANYCTTCAEELRSVASREDRPLMPISVYGWTKKQQEEQLSYLARTYQVPVVIMRYQNVYGSRQSLSNPYTGIVSIFFSRIQAGNPISIYEGGTPSRDFIHISDVVIANILAMESDVGSDITLNIGTGNPVSVLDVATALARPCKTTPSYRNTGEYRLGDIHSCYADTTRSSELLGFKARTSLEQGMEEFVEWAKDQETKDLYEKAIHELKSRGLFGRAGGPT